MCKALVVVGDCGTGIITRTSNWAVGLVRFGVRADGFCCTV